MCCGGRDHHGCQSIVNHKINGMPNMDTIIPITDFSSCDKLFRITALVLRFVKNVKIKAKLLKEGTVYSGDITAEEIGNAEVKWLRSVQKD